MSFSSLPLELRNEIYSYVIFDTPEPPPQLPPIRIGKGLRSEKENFRERLVFDSFSSASPQEVSRYFMYHMVDPAQPRGSLITEYGSHRPYLSTPTTRRSTIAEDLSARAPLPTLAALLSQRSRKVYEFYPLLLTSRWVADEVRAWLYPQLTFDFDYTSSGAFELFSARLMPETRKFVRSLRVHIPIYSFEALNRTRLFRVLGVENQLPLNDEDYHVYQGLAWRRAIPRDVAKVFPNLRAVHVHLLHQSRRPAMGTGLGAPVGDMTWREEALEPVLRFQTLPLKEVTVVAENMWPWTELWSGDPRVAQYRELAGWLRKRLLGD